MGMMEYNREWECGTRVECVHNFLHIKRACDNGNYVDIDCECPQC